MSLSKVYRGQEFTELESFEFRSFAQGGNGGAVANEPSRTPRAESLAVQADVGDAFKRGRQEGVTAAESKLDSTLKALIEALDEVNRLREKLARNSSQDMLRMVMAISEQVILHEVQAAPEIILSVIEKALNASVQADAYRIRVSAQDLDIVTAQKPLFLASISGMKNISIIPDAALSPGGCRVESDFGDVDASIESQLAEIQKVLAGAIAGDE